MTPIQHLSGSFLSNLSSSWTSWHFGRLVRGYNQTCPTTTWRTYDAPLSLCFEAATFSCESLFLVSTPSPWPFGSHKFPGPCFSCQSFIHLLQQPKVAFLAFSLFQHLVAPLDSGLFRALLPLFAFALSLISQRLELGPPSVL